MGWCSGTDVFDDMVGAFLDPELGLSEEQRQALIVELADTLEDHDWDCQSDSIFYEHPEVLSAMKELHPGWFEEG